jgi:hypothetical protein
MRCHPRDAFVVLLSSPRFAPAALCIQRQLTRVRTACPLYLVLDDHTWTSMKQSERWQSTVRNIVSVYSDRIIMLSTLLSEAGHALEASNMFHSNVSTRASARMFAQAKKLWLFALPASRFRRIAFLDLDLLITRNIDVLLPPAAAVDSRRMDAVQVPNCTPHGVPVFNSGVLVFSPSLHTLHALLMRFRFSTAPWLGALPEHAHEPTQMTTSKDTSPDAWPAWVDRCAPASPLFGGSASNATEHRCFMPSCLRAAQLFPTSRNPFDACRRAHGGHLAAASRLRAFVDASCEPKATDQSVLNWHVWCHEAVGWKPCSPQEAHSDRAGRVRWLPYEFNAKWDGKRHGATLKVCRGRTRSPKSGDRAVQERHDEAWRRQLAALPAILHFHGPRKPWALESATTMAGKVWSRWCELGDCVPPPLSA